LLDGVWYLRIAHNVGNTIVTNQRQIGRFLVNFCRVKRQEKDANNGQQALIFFFSISIRQNCDQSNACDAGRTMAMESE